MKKMKTMITEYDGDDMKKMTAMTIMNIKTTTMMI